MNLPLSHRAEFQLASGAMMRFITIALALVLVSFSAMAAHLAQTTEDRAGHTAIAAIVVTEQPAATDASFGESSLGATGGLIATGLASGCVVLVLCCVLALALLGARAWRTGGFRLVRAVAPLLRLVVLGLTRAVVASRRPCLIALSISRT